MSTFPDALAQLAASQVHFGSLVASPLTATLFVLLQVVVFAAVAGTATAWWSWVDRIWSLSPAVYVVLYAALSPFSSRLWVMAALSSLWAARLTFNFWRKGGFGEVKPSEEDYRWPIVRAWMARNLPAQLLPLAMHSFHLLFVCLYQNVLLWLQVVPTCMAAAGGSPSLQPLDYWAATLFLALLALETLTDETQWAFQSAKHAMTPAQRQAAGGDFARGFCTTGIFAVTRHGNFFAEFSMWWAFFAFGVAARAPDSLSQALLHYSAAGPLLLTLLFQGSTALTEQITASKYPEYTAYQARVSCFLPWWASSAPEEAAAAPSAKVGLKSAGKGRRGSVSAK